MVTRSIDSTVQSRKRMRSLEMISRKDYLQEHFDTLCDSFHDQHTRKERIIEQFAVTQYIYFFQKVASGPSDPRVSLLLSECLDFTAYQ